MAGYKKLSYKQQCTELGRTHRLYFTEGKTPEEIAAIVKEPLPRIQHWIEQLEAVRKRKLENG